MYFLTIVRTSPPQVITIYEFYRNMPAFANEDATVVEHHPRMEESEVSEEMSNLTLSSRVRPVDDLQCDKIFRYGSLRLLPSAKKMIYVP